MIATDDALVSSCETVRVFPAIAPDTEFARTRTYYPQLGLIQLFDGEHLTLIDPLRITGWSSLEATLYGPSITEFLHAGSENPEVFLNVFGELPRPLIDTQTLAAFCGRPISWGFASMVEEYSGVMLDKSESRTDWLAKPLTECQCEYAVADVWYLLPITAKLMVEMEVSGWLPVALDECHLIQMHRQEVVTPKDVWRDVTDARQLCTHQLAYLQPLVDWRLRKVQERDLAVNSVVREEYLWPIARYMPGSLDELDSLGLSGSKIRFHGKTLLALAGKAQTLLEEVLPQPMLNLMDMPGYRKAFKMTKSLITDMSETHRIDAELLASRRQINQPLNWHRKLKPQNGLPELISDWRGELTAGTLRSLLQEYPQWNFLKPDRTRLAPHPALIDYKPNTRRLPFTRERQINILYWLARSSSLEY